MKLKYIICIAVVVFFVPIHLQARMPMAVFGADTVLGIGAGIEYQSAKHQDDSRLMAIDVSAMYGFFSLISIKAEFNAGYIFRENAPYANLLIGAGVLFFFFELGYYQIISDPTGSAVQFGFSGTIYSKDDAPCVSLFVRYLNFVNSEDIYSNRVQLGIKGMFNFSNKNRY